MTNEASDEAPSIGQIHYSPHGVLQVAEKAEIKFNRGSSLYTGLVLLMLAGIGWYISLFENEEDLLSSDARRAGIFKLIEQAIGWGPFVALMLFFATFALVRSVIALWKAVDGRPVVAAKPDRLEFHPAVKRQSALYEEVSHWSAELDGDEPALCLHFVESFWSPQSLFKRKTVELAGSKEQLEPLFQFLSQHPDMQHKLAK